jgi:hypothetical protein
VFLLIARIIRQALLLAALIGTLALSACSALKLGYEQTPLLLYWWLDGHVDFGNTQAPAVRQTLAQLHRWHRTTELPAYADVLGQLSQAAAHPIDAGQVCAFTTEVQHAMDRLARESIRQTAAIVSQLDERQRMHLERYWIDKNRQWEKDWLNSPADKRLHKRVDSAVERYEDFYGALTPAQTGIVKRHVQQSVWTPEWGQQERLRRQKDVLAALDRIRLEAMNSVQAEAVLLAVWQRWLQSPAAADRERLQSWSEQGCHHLAELHNSTSAEQRARAAKRLRAYEKDLRELTGRS